jgi:uncharacterized membrane protein
MHRHPRLTDPLPPHSELTNRVALGIIAFLALVVVFYLMVAKPA